MTSRDFAYWLQGYMELRKEAPGGTSAGPPSHQAKLDEVHHHGKPPSAPYGGPVMRC